MIINGLNIRNLVQLKCNSNRRCNTYNSEDTVSSSNAWTEVTFHQFEGEPVIIKSAYESRIRESDKIPENFTHITVSHRYNESEVDELENGRKFESISIFVATDEITPEEFLEERGNYDGDEALHLDIARRATNEFSTLAVISSEVIPTTSGKPCVCLVDSDKGDIVTYSRKDAIDRAAKVAFAGGISFYQNRK